MFLTASSDMPTFMVVAMALRLAEHLREERRPHVAIDSAAVCQRSDLQTLSAPSIESRAG